MIAWAVVALSLAAEPAHFVWPRPELIDELPISEVTRADGVPVRLHTFRSRLSADVLLQAYANAFDAAGFYIALKQPRVTLEPHITALDWRTKISYSAILSPNPDGTTSCLLGEAALGKRKEPGGTADFAPVMPNAREIARLDQETERLISFSVRNSPDAVVRFYRDSLPTAGFVPAEDETNLYTRGLERVRVMTTANTNGTTSVVLLHRRAEK